MKFFIISCDLQSRAAYTLFFSALSKRIDQCGPTTGPRATTFSVARRSIQEKSANVQLVEKCVRLHLSHWIACAG